MIIRMAGARWPGVFRARRVCTKERPQWIASQSRRSSGKLQCAVQKYRNTCCAVASVSAPGPSSSWLQDAQKHLRRRPCFGWFEGIWGPGAGYRCFKFAVVGFDDSELLQLWVLWVYDALPPSWRRLRRSDPVESEPQDPGLTPSPELLKVTAGLP